MLYHIRMVTLYYHMHPPLVVDHLLLYMILIK